MEIIFGTTNQEKVKQVKRFFKVANIDTKIRSLKDIGFNQKIEENGKTFEENSLIKALVIKQYCNKNNINQIIITDDTGLCVDCLNGEPGIYSARYAGEGASQEVILNKLLNKMKHVENEKRTAKFICVLTAILPNGEKIVAKGETNGKIAHKYETLGKLTYGPIFIPDGFNKVLNELTDKELGQTHREKAFIEIIRKLQNISKI